MTEFRKYMHVERFGNDEVQGIELGDCYVFPKIDGTNGSVWVDSRGDIQAGSRNRQLSIGADNAGFLAFVQEDESIQNYMRAYPNHRLYGEWLVPHSLQTYREDAWRKFYVFDVFDEEAERFLTFDEYAATLDFFNIDYLHPLSIIKNATYENFLKELEKNTVLIEDGKGVGEGVVIKNYDFQNRFGNVVWAKIVTTSFKEKHTKAMGPSIMKGKPMVEQFIVDQYVDQHFVDKVYAKIVNEEGGWNSKYIPRLLNTVFYDLINEEMWNIVKKTKNPTINFKTLNTLMIIQVKQLKPEIF